jgi:anthranilate synthase component 1
MTPEHFSQLAAEGYNRIPVMREVLADLDTPLSSYLKLARGAYSYLFESVTGGEKWGRYSMIGLPARTVLKAFGDNIQIERDGVIVEQTTCADALAFVEEFKQRYRAPELPGLPRFTGGLVGYFAYDCVRYVEPHLKASTPKDVINTPDILLSVSDEVLVFDNLAGKLIFVVHANPEINNAYQLALQRLDELEMRLRGSVPNTPNLTLGMNGASEQQFHSHFGEQHFHNAVNHIKDYVLAGDTMQVVVSWRSCATRTWKDAAIWAWWSGALFGCRAHRSARPRWRCCCVRSLRGSAGHRRRWRCRTGAASCTTGSPCPSTWSKTSKTW